MKSLIAIFTLLFAPIATAVDNPLTCTGASCKVQLVPRTSGGVATPAVTALGNGNVGVGTASPGAQLHVFGPNSGGYSSVKIDGDVSGGVHTLLDVGYFNGTSHVPGLQVNNSNFLVLPPLGTGQLIIAPSASGVVSSSNVFTAAIGCIGTGGSGLFIGIAGGWSCTRNSIGTYTVAFGGTFSAAPICTVSSQASQGGASFNGTPSSSSAVVVTFNSAGTLTDQSVSVVCIGAR